MLYVLSDGTIQLTRGDTARLSVSITNDLTKESYKVEETDTLILTVKRSVKDDCALFQKRARGSTSFHIEPADTSGIPFGKYKYDVQLNKDNGDVYTIVKPSCFEIMPEVTY